jgi:hypothetical protein
MFEVPINTELRLVSPEIGVGLFASRDFAKDECVFTSKPLLAMQHVANQRVAYCCQHCFKHLGGVLGQMECLFREDAFSEIFKKISKLTELHSNSSVVKCECGVSYCSESCRWAAWGRHHSVFCVAEGDPAVLEFKMYCLEVEGCGDTLLLAAYAMLDFAKAKEMLKFKHLPFQQVTLNFSNFSPDQTFPLGIPVSKYIRAWILFP